MSNLTTGLVSPRKWTVQGPLFFLCTAPRRITQRPGDSWARCSNSGSRFTAWIDAGAVRAGTEMIIRSNVHTLPRELRAENDFDITAIEDRLRKVDAPILLLLGGDSPRELVEPSARLAAILSTSRVEKIDGESHAAMFGSPDAFVGIVNRFFDENAS
jgi:pimeloyl-ACP methyl ester carboxylesterase